jgi:citrate synthase
MSWKTAITKVEPNKLTVRGHDLASLIGTASFAQVVYLLLMGEFPDDKRAQLVEAILVSSVDHGATPPSCLAARTVASCGVPLTTALAAGVMSIGSYHGGAIEECMKTLARAAETKRKEGKSIQDIAEQTIAEAKAKGKRLSGFGHRIHTQDPRTTKLLEMAKSLGLAGDGVALAEAIADSFQRQGKNLPLNVDGAIAALLVDLGVPAELGNAFFVISRVPGLVAHVHEEQTREKPMRVITPGDVEYDGKEAS